jgi:pilus assembly protein Flp/PilA
VTTAGRASDGAGNAAGADTLFHPSYLGGVPMRSLTKNVVEFLKREDGPTAVEYAVMLALIVVVCIAAITAIGSASNQTFSSVGSALQPS